LNPENDTGVLVNYLSQTIEESRRLREDLKRGGRGGEAREPSPEEASPPEDVPGTGSSDQK
jgi:hypothetical protein